MRIYRIIKVSSIVFLSVILFLFFITIFRWQYLEYKKESNDFKFQIIKYEEFYVKDRNNLEGKTVEELQSLINNAENEINKCSCLIPDSNYMNLYNFISEIKRLFNLNDVVFEINNIESIKKDFYEEVNYSVTLRGQSSGIIGCIEQMTDRNEIVLLREVCLLNRKTNNISVVKLKFKTYMFIGPEKWARKKPKRKIPIEEREIKTWLPPLSIWAKDYKDRAIELKQLEKTKQKLKLKLEMYDAYKKKLKKLRQLETIIDHLGDSSRKTGVSINNISRCTDL